MGESKHTEGPWELIVRPYGECDIRCNDWEIAQTFGSVGGGDDDEESYANARLIAAAPDMLEALKTAKETIRAWHGPNAWDIYDRVSPEMRVINEAIAKAQGGAQ